MDPNCPNVIEIADDDHFIEPNFQLTRVTPRKIVFCIDISLEINAELKASLNCGLKDTNMYYSTWLETIQRFLKRYTHTNALLGNDKDLYAIMLLSDKAVWWCDFTSDISVINGEIDLLDGEIITKYEELDTQTIFDVLATKVNVEDSNWFIQTIVIYSRGNVLPTAVTGNDYLTIRGSSNFTLDILFLHDKKSDITQAIYDFWSGLDNEAVPGWYYETGVFQGKDTLSKALAQLIAHPLQRHRNQEQIGSFIQ